MGLFTGKNQVTDRGKFFEMALDGKFGRRVVILDRADLGMVQQYKWRLRQQRSGNFYVVASRRVDGRPETLELGRWLLGVTSSDTVVWHINRDTLDYRRENLSVMGMYRARVEAGAYGEPGKTGQGAYTAMKREVQKFRREHGLAKTGRLPVWALRELRERGVI